MAQYSGAIDGDTYTAAEERDAEFVIGARLQIEIDRRIDHQSLGPEVTDQDTVGSDVEGGELVVFEAVEIIDDAGHASRRQSGKDIELR